MRPIEERDVTETLEACEAAWLARVEADCEIFVCAAHFAHLSSGEDLPTRIRRSREGGVLPGTERRVQLGGAGTPNVAEFAAAELGARLRMGTRGAHALIADALDAQHRLPRLWAPHPGQGGPRRLGAPRRPGHPRADGRGRRPGRRRGRRDRRRPGALVEVRGDRHRSGRRLRPRPGRPQGGRGPHQGPRPRLAALPVRHEGIQPVGAHRRRRRLRRHRRLPRRRTRRPRRHRHRGRTPRQGLRRPRQPHASRRAPRRLRPPPHPHPGGHRAGPAPRRP